MTPPKALVDAPVTGDPANETTMNHVLNMFGVVPSATIQDVLDIAGKLLCYEYRDA
jgi:tyrosinase